jgi:hypothetical protein
VFAAQNSYSSLFIASFSGALYTAEFTMDDGFRTIWLGVVMAYIECNSKIYLQGIRKVM